MFNIHQCSQPLCAAIQNQRHGLSKILTSHVNGFRCHTLNTVKVVQWSDLVSNKKLHWQTGQLSILSTMFTGSVKSSNNLITTPLESSTCFTCHLQTGDDLYQINLRLEDVLTLC